MRNATIDYAKLVAAAGIVIFHAGAPGASIGYAALPFFVMLLICFAWPSAEREPLATYTLGQVRRLMTPWAIWSAIYGTLKLVEVAATGKPVSEEFSPWMWLTGPSIHLWFLPFAFAACLALRPLARASASWSARGSLGFAAGCAGLAVAILMATQGMVLPTPTAQWAFGLPAVALGVAFSLTQRAERPRLATSFVVAFTMAGLAFTAWVPGAFQIALAMVALWLTFTFPLPESRAAQLCAKLSIMLYLAHPLVASVLYRLTPFKDSSTLALVTVFVTLALALALHFTMMRLQKQARPSLIT